MQTNFFGNLIGNKAGFQRVKVNDYIISIEFDTVLHNKNDGILRKFDLRVYDKYGAEVTDCVFNCKKGDAVAGTLENFEYAVNWCRTH